MINLIDMLYLIYTKVLQILNYKCDECEFWGPNTLTMEVHVKKVHCETITYKPLLTYILSYVLKNEIENQE